MRGYEDIINLPHPESKNHPRMSMYDRAAQFSPFAALTGYGDAVKETARLTEHEMLLDEESKVKLDEKLKEIMSRQDLKAVITYFIPDEKKEGGKYVDRVCKIKRLDYQRRKIILDNNEEIDVDFVMDLKTES